MTHFKTGPEILALLGGSALVVFLLKVQFLVNFYALEWLCRSPRASSGLQTSWPLKVAMMTGFKTGTEIIDPLGGSMLGVF